MLMRSLILLVAHELAANDSSAGQVAKAMWRSGRPNHDHHAQEEARPLMPKHVEKLLKASYGAMSAQHALAKLWMPFWMQVRLCTCQMVVDFQTLNPV